MKLVIVGGGVAGIACARTVRRLAPDCQITILSDEPYPFYSKSLLSHYFSGDGDPSSLMPLPKDFYLANGITLEKGVRAESILPAEHKVIGNNGRDYFFDRLLVSTGASPYFPKGKIKGLDKGGVFGLRTLSDAQAILKSLGASGRVVIIGGGLLGLESATHLKRAGYQVTVLEIEKRLLTTVIDDDLSSWLKLEERFLEAGYDLRLGTAALEVLGEKKAEGLAVKEGAARKYLPADVVLLCAGVVPNVGLARESGIAVEEGIVTDKYQRTNFSEIYAAGDVAQGIDLISGGNSLFPIWPVAAEQGRVAGYNISGYQEEYPGAIRLNAFQFFGIPVCCLGLVKARPGPGREVVTQENQEGETYSRVILEDGHLVGAALAGEIGSAGMIYKLIRERTAVRQRKDEIVKALSSPKLTLSPSIRPLY